MKWDKILSDGSTEVLSEVHPTGSALESCALLAVVRLPRGLVSPRWFYRDGSTRSASPRLVAAPRPWIELSDIPSDFFNGWVFFLGTWRKVDRVVPGAVDSIYFSGCSVAYSPSELFGAEYAASPVDTPRPCQTHET